MNFSSFRLPGLGWFLTNVTDCDLCRRRKMSSVVSHHGILDGSSALLAILLDLDMIVVVLANTDVQLSSLESLALKIACNFVDD